MDKPLLTFEECLDYIEKESGCKYLNWQKEFFRTIYDYPELYIMPTRQDGIIALCEAKRTLDKLLGKEENIIKDELIKLVDKLNFKGE